MSQAGFHFTPNEEEKDCATCNYCDCSLGGWEKSDDPVQEHQRRRPECPFFNARLETEGGSRVASASTSKKRRVASKRKVVGEEEKEVEEDESNATRKMSIQEKEFKKQEEAVDIVPPKRTSSRKKAKKGDETEKVQHQPDPSDGTPPGKTTTAAEEKAPSAESAIHSSEALREADNNILKDTLAHAVKQDLKTSDWDENVPHNNMHKGSKEGQEEPPNSDGHSSPAANVDEKTKVGPAPIEVLSSENVETEEKQMQSPAGTNDSRPVSSADTNIAVPPLHQLTAELATDENITVEAWLKRQVSQACEEMEREGKQRIEKLRAEMTRSRVEIEAILRGEHQTSDRQGSLPNTPIAIS